MIDVPLDASGLTYRQLLERDYRDVEVSHVHHGGNSSGIVDGAGAVLLASPEYAKANGLKPRARIRRSEEHTSELQSLMRKSYAVFCLKQKQRKSQHTTTRHNTNHKNTRYS